MFITDNSFFLTDFKTYILFFVFYLLLTYLVEKINFSEKISVFRFSKITKIVIWIISILLNTVIIALMYHYNIPIGIGIFYHAFMFMLSVQLFGWIIK